MHVYIEYAIVMAARSCENHLQLAHIFGRECAFTGEYHRDMAADCAAQAWGLVEKDARARAEKLIPTGDHWL